MDFRDQIPLPQFHDPRSTKAASHEEREQAHHDGIISGIGTSITFDSTDSAVKPHNGFRSSLEGEFVGIWGDYSFLRFAYVNSYYTQLWRHGIMKYRWDLRFIEPIFKTNSPTKIPLSERFFIGGLNSVRGYRDFDLGPHFQRRRPQGRHFLNRSFDRIFARGSPNHGLICLRRCRQHCIKTFLFFHF